MTIQIMNDKPLIKSLFSIQKIKNYIDDKSYIEFIQDSLCVDACITQLIQLGEMERRMTKEYKESHPEVPWKEINGLRNVVVHNYDGIDYLSVWETLEEDIPSLEKIYINLLQIDFEYTVEEIEEKVQQEFDQMYLKINTSKGMSL